MNFLWALWSMLAALILVGSFGIGYTLYRLFNNPTLSWVVSAAIFMFYAGYVVATMNWLNSDEEATNDSSTTY